MGRMFIGNEHNDNGMHVHLKFKLSWKSKLFKDY